MPATTILGTPLKYDVSQVYSHQVEAKDASSFLIGYGQDDVYAVGGTLSDLDITLGTKQSLYFASAINKLAVGKVSDTEFGVYYGGSGYGSKISYVNMSTPPEVTVGTRTDIVFDPDGVEIGAIPALPGKGILIKSLGTNSIKANIYTLSGNTFSVGSTFTKEGTGANIYFSGSKKLVRLDADGYRWLWVYPDAQNSYYATGIVITTDGNNISFGIPTVINSAVAQMIGAYQHPGDTDNPVVYYFDANIVYARTLNISGTTITVNSEVRVSSPSLTSAQYPAGCAMNSEYGLISYKANDGSDKLRVTVLSKSGNTLVAGESTDRASVSGVDYTMTSLSEDKFIVGYIAGNEGYIVAGQLDAGGVIIETDITGDLTVSSSVTPSVGYNYSDTMDLTISGVVTAEIASNYIVDIEGDLSLVGTYTIQVIEAPYYGTDRSTWSRVTITTSNTSKIT